MNGRQAEHLARKIITEAGYSFCRLPSEMKLISAAARLAPKRLARATEEYEEMGVSIYHLSSADILDDVYGLDAVVLINGVVVGIDFSIDTSQRLVSKRIKLSNLASLHAEIGIHVTGIWNPVTQTLESFLADLGV